MSYVVDKVNLLAIIGGLTDKSPAATTWGLDPQTIVGDQDRAQISLQVFSIMPLGVDEHRRTLSDGTDGYPVGTWWVLEIGSREVIINVRVEAYDFSVEAAELVDQIRTRIRAEAVAASLNAIGLAFEWASSTTRMPIVRNERAVSCAVADFKFAAVARWVSVIQPPSQGGDYIAIIDAPNNYPAGTFS